MSKNLIFTFDKREILERRLWENKLSPDNFYNKSDTQVAAHYRSDNPGIESCAIEPTGFKIAYSIFDKTTKSRTIFYEIDPQSP